jgi:hypothetical protein
MSKKNSKESKQPTPKIILKENPTPTPNHNQVFKSVEDLGTDLLSGSKSKWLDWAGSFLKYISNKLK